MDNSMINIVMESIGGMNPAYEYSCYVLKNGKHVVTANKEIVASHIQELIELSRKNNKVFLQLVRLTFLILKK